LRAIAWQSQNHPQNPKLKQIKKMQPSVTSKKTPSLRAIAWQSQNHTQNPKLKQSKNMQPSVT